MSAMIRKLPLVMDYSQQQHNENVRFTFDIVTMKNGHVLLSV